MLKIEIPGRRKNVNFLIGPVEGFIELQKIVSIKSKGHNKPTKKRFHFQRKKMLTTYSASL